MEMAKWVLRGQGLRCTSPLTTRPLCLPLTPRFAALPQGLVPNKGISDTYLMRKKPLHFYGEGLEMGDVAGFKIPGDVTVYIQVRQNP